MRHAAFEALISLPGYGGLSVRNLLDSIEASRDTDFVSFMHALGIPNVGKGQAKLLRDYIVKEFPKENELIYTEDGISKPVTVFDALVQMVFYDFDFTRIPGIGPVIADSLTSYIDVNVIAPLKVHAEESDVLALLEELRFADEWPKVESYNFSGLSPIAGKTFVVTGAVNYFDNRNALHSKIESLGGKTAGSVSKNTDYLITNDTSSGSAKNKKAAELGVKVITEHEFLCMIGEA